MLKHRHFIKIHPALAPAAGAERGRARERSGAGGAAACPERARSGGSGRDSPLGIHGPTEAPAASPEPLLRQDRASRAG